MKKMDEKEIVALKAIVRAGVALVINVGLAIHAKTDDGRSFATDDAMDMADDLVDRFNELLAVEGL
jgi:hypothetical protein